MFDCLTRPQFSHPYCLFRMFVTLVYRIYNLFSTVFMVYCTHMFKIVLTLSTPTFMRPNSTTSNFTVSLAGSLGDSPLSFFFLADSPLLLFFLADSPLPFFFLADSPLFFRVGSHLSLFFCLFFANPQLLFITKILLFLSPSPAAHFFLRNFAVFSVS